MRIRQIAGSAAVSVLAACSGGGTDVGSPEQECDSFSRTIPAYEYVVVTPVENEGQEMTYIAVNSITKVIITQTRQLSPRNIDLDARAIDQAVLSTSQTMEADFSEKNINVSFTVHEQTEASGSVMVDFESCKV